MQKIIMILIELLKYKKLNPIVPKYKNKFLKSKYNIGIMKYLFNKENIKYCNNALKILQQ